MPFKSKVEQVDDYVRITSTGSLASVAEVEDYVALIRNEALAHNVKKALLDERSLMDQQDTLDAYQVSESETASMAALSGIRLSCICHPRNYELNKTYETLLLNRSLIFRAFLTEKEALIWLNGGMVAPAPPLPE